ncbi:hypothetical protein N2152v2_000294 [Parachlorella kessleri]
MPARGASLVVQRHHLSARCKRGVAATPAAVGQPGSTREGEDAEPAGSSGSSPSGSLSSDSSCSGSGSGSSSDEDVIAAVLASAGLDPAELQRQAPEAYSQLSVALAQVLAEVVVDRAASSKFTRVPPAELMARICFLAWEVGLTVADIRAGHRKSGKFLFFTLDGARRLHRWLEMQHLSTDQLRLASRSYSTLWAINALTFQRSKKHVQQQLAVTHTQWCKAFTTRPVAVLASPERVSGVIAWLEAKPLGLSRAKAAQLWLCQPVLFSLSAEVLQHRLGQLVSRFALREIDMRRVVCSSPTLLTIGAHTFASKMDSLLAVEPCLRASIPSLLCNGGSALAHSTETIQSKVNFLRNYGFNEGQLTYALRRNYMALTSNIEDNFKPTLAALRRVLGSQEGVVGAVATEPKLLATALETLEGNVEAMQALGLSPADIRASVGRQPQLFVYNYKSEDFQDKLRYFEAVLGRSPWQMLVVQPVLLKSALWRVDYRYGYSLAEYVGWREQWVGSERARLYGLAKEPGMARAHRARDKRGRAKVAARREEVLAAGEEQG